MRLEKLNRRFANGGVDEQQGSNNIFAATNFRAFAPTIAAGLDLSQYSKDVKESEANRLAAFKDMKAADALMADQNKARELGAKYQSAFDEAHKTLRNPFDLTRFAQKQAVAYVNDPLRRNIEESSVNRKTSAALMAQDKNADTKATLGWMDLDDYLHEQKGGTSDNVQSIRQVTPTVRNVNPAESLSKVANINYEDGSTWSRLTPAQQDFMYGMGINEKTWSKGTKQSRVNALVDLTLNQDPELKRSLEGHAFVDLKNDALNAGLSEAEAKKYAYDNLYNPKARNSAKSKMQSLLTSGQTTMMHSERGNDLSQFNTLLGMASSKEGGPEQPNTTMKFTDQTVSKNESDRVFSNDDIKLFSDEGRSNFDANYNELSSMLKDKGSKGNIKDLLNIMNKSLKENPRASAVDIVHNFFGEKRDERNPHLVLNRTIANKAEDLYKQLKRSQELKDVLKNKYGYSDEFLRHPKNAIDAMMGASKTDMYMETTVNQGSNAVSEYASKYLIPNLQTQKIKLGDNEMQEFGKFANDITGNWIVWDKKGEKNEVFKDIVGADMVGAGFTFQPDKKGKSTTPMFKFTATKDSGNIKAGDAIYTAVPLQMESKMDDVAKLMSQIYDKSATPKYIPINLGNGSRKYSIIHKDGNPILLNGDGKAVQFSELDNLIEAYLRQFHETTSTKTGIEVDSKEK
jgi:hypothetical protein